MHSARLKRSAEIQLGSDFDAGFQCLLSWTAFVGRDDLEQCIGHHADDDIYRAVLREKLGVLVVQLDRLGHTSPPICDRHDLVDLALLDRSCQVLAELERRVESMT